MGKEDQRGAEGRMAGEQCILRDVCVAEYPRLVGALRLVSGDDAYLAEEFAQEALARLCRDWERVSRGSSPRAWLYRVALNLGNSHWRRVAVRRRVEPRLVQAEAVADHAAGAAERVDVHRGLAQLSNRERAAIVLRYFADLPVTQAAEALGVSEQALRNLNYRAIKKLRAILSDEIAPTQVSP